MANDDTHSAAAADATIAGLASLSLIEATLLTLREKNVITDVEYDDAFQAAIDAHCRASTDPTADMHGKVAKLLKSLRVHGNSVRLASTAGASAPKGESLRDDRD